VRKFVLGENDYNTKMQNFWSHFFPLLNTQYYNSISSTQKRSYIYWKNDYHTSNILFFRLSRRLSYMRIKCAFLYQHPIC